MGTIVVGRYCIRGRLRYAVDGRMEGGRLYEERTLYEGRRNGAALRLRGADDLNPPPPTRPPLTAVAVNGPINMIVRLTATAKDRSVIRSFEPVPRFEKRTFMWERKFLYHLRWRGASSHTASMEDTAVETKGCGGPW